MIEEKGQAVGKFIVHKFSDQEHYKRCQHYERSEFNNVLLNEGITRLLNLLVGGGGTAYTSAASELGVGDSSAAAVATSTGLLSTANTFYVAVSSITIAGQAVTWRGVFSSGVGNFNWREFTIVNSTTNNAGENLNRAVSNQGTKAAGQTWTLDLQLTVS